MLSNATELDKKNATNHAMRWWFKATRNCVAQELVRDPECAARRDFPFAWSGGWTLETGGVIFATRR
jgi:hypothetical protein